LCRYNGHAARARDIAILLQHAARAHEGHASDVRRQFLQELQSFAKVLRPGGLRYTRQVPARPSETCDEASSDQIILEQCHDGNITGGIEGCVMQPSAPAERDHIHATRKQLDQHA
jgi:hypothetical protein